MKLDLEQWMAAQIFAFADLSVVVRHVGMQLHGRRRACFGRTNGAVVIQGICRFLTFWIT